ncbi:hypothetical protein G4B88_029765 [Cannabis sativa]|uniref:Uncharacterized protein n=1 Tax=Cannabis sativa TaxID=3483 RepID=A0A7J6GGI4_CANSA|nr:hypothetical protein G4B88_029765 [Cannabis sativa]
MTDFFLEALFRFCDPYQAYILFLSFVSEFMPHACISHQSQLFASKKMKMLVGVEHGHKPIIVTTLKMHEHN